MVTDEDIREFARLLEGLSEKERFEAIEKLMRWLALISEYEANQAAFKAIERDLEAKKKEGGE